MTTLIWIMTFPSSHYFCTCLLSILSVHKTLFRLCHFYSSRLQVVSQSTRSESHSISQPCIKPLTLAPICSPAVHSALVLGTLPQCASWTHAFCVQCFPSDIWIACVLTSWALYSHIIYCAFPGHIIYCKPPSHILALFLFLLSTKHVMYFTDLFYFLSTYFTRM